MPFGGLLSIAAPLLSIGSSAMGLFGGGGTPSSNVKGYDYQYRPQADQNAMGGITQLSQLGNMGVNAATNIQNNPYSQGYLNDVQGIGGQAKAAGQGITGSALSMLPDVQALMSLGFDPQNALYSKLQNQNQQQNAAILGQSGVASTPYGGGVAADANSNFNINWQNQQLQRALAGAGGANSLLQGINGNAGAGIGLQTQGAALPYSTFTGINTDALGSLGQAAGIGQTATNDWLSYLSGGTNQQGANLNQANSSFSQNQALGSGLGQGLAGLSKGWGNLNLGGGGSTGWGLPAASAVGI